jgi:hypothetical protein
MKRASLTYKIVCTLVAGSTVLIFGCGKSPTTSAEQSKPVETPPAAPPVHPPQNPQPIAVPAAAAADYTATLDALTQALRKYTVEHRGLPRAFAEVVAAGYVKNLPAAPPGKRFEIEPKSARVVLVNQ